MQSPRFTPRSVSASPPRSRQGGTALIVALVALVSMITAGFALFRSVDTANLAAGNYQFVRSAEQSVDLAMNEALLAYMQSHPNAGVNVMDRNNSDATIAYFATQQVQTGDGIPQVLSDLTAPAWSLAGPTASGWPGEQIDNNSRQLRRYVIERLCTQPGIATAANCRLYEFQFPSNCSSVGGGGCAGTTSDWLPFIRITVRIDGPKNAVAYAQMFMKAE